VFRASIQRRFVTSFLVGVRYTSVPCSVLVSAQ
jgi:hypothetical protein